jgi:hypothetical protein
MKRILMITVFFSVLAVSSVSAQMGHGMMRDSHMMGQGGHMMGEQGVKGSGQMMDHGRMMGNVQGMTRYMSNMMGQLSGMISQDMPGERRHKVSEMMRDVAAEMNRLSFIIDRGSATVGEMNDLESRMTELHKHMSEITK